MATFLSEQTLRQNAFFVRAIHRQLWRATAIAFKGDKNMLTESRKRIHDEFVMNRNIKPGSMEAAQAVEQAQGVAKILRENVVQGENRGGELYKLNIHEHTQRLDNDTAGELKGTTKSFREIKDATF